MSRYTPWRFWSDVVFIFVDGGLAGYHLATGSPWLALLFTGLALLIVPGMYNHIELEN